MEDIHCSGITFTRNFDSANLSRVEVVEATNSADENASNPPPNITHARTKSMSDQPDHEFNIWTKPDCGGTEFENANRTWFHFGMKANSSSLLIKLNIVDLNKQVKMYSQGMSPVYRVVPSRFGWERIRDKPTYCNNEEIFTLSFRYRTPENPHAITYFAFTYPFSYNEIQRFLNNIDLKVSTYTQINFDDIYYVRECVCRSPDNRRIDLLTITSRKGISHEREVRLKNLFPDRTQPRPFLFPNKKVIFMSARVHPGETPSSFVFNGFLHLLVNRDDPIAIALRRLYVFKLIPCLNPDGVARGHYRTDAKGINLNRMYLNPSLMDHPSIYAARSLIRYYHYRAEKPDIAACETFLQTVKLDSDDDEIVPFVNPYPSDNFDSGLFLYVDMHGHASKKGIFMYGNHFAKDDQNTECMLFPKLMSLNNYNFHFTSCNFTEKNMFVKDKRDGASRAGSGRVAVSLLTGLIKSYTLECNYNTGRIVNVLPPTLRERTRKTNQPEVPPKYTPAHYEEVGLCLGASILDLTGNNPFTRVTQSEFHTLSGVMEWIRCNCLKNAGDTCLNNNHIKTKLKTNLCQVLKRRAIPKKPSRVRLMSVPIERKENVDYEFDNKKTNSAPVVKIMRKKSSFKLHKTTVKNSKMKLTYSVKSKNTIADKGKSTGLMKLENKSDNCIDANNVGKNVPEASCSSEGNYFHKKKFRKSPGDRSNNIDKIKKRKRFAK